ncbi:MAG: biotin transporter BioY [Treponema sp.]
MRNGIFSAIFAALICAGWMIAIPLGPIPIVLQNALAVLAGLLLGPLYGSLSVLLFLIAGMLGLPVFSGGRGGLAVLAGPTGGFLIGYFFAAFLAGGIAGLLLKNQRSRRFTYITMAAAALAGFALIYVFGLLRFKQVLNLSWPHTFVKGFLPFIIPDLIKTLIIVPAAVKIRPILNRYTA